MSDGIDLKKLNGKTIMLGNLIEGIKRITQNDKTKIYVPMYQRNYKWKKDTAIKLIKDLIKCFKENKDKSISLFTLYIDDKNNIQVVDGQQRMITLLLLYSAIGAKEEFINLEFERDFQLIQEQRRIEFIDIISNKNNIEELFSKEDVALTDKRRLAYNYNSSKEVLKEIKKEDLEEFIKYLRENVKLLLHITKDEPVSEFLNLNYNKTEFSICDKIRSSLITYTTFHKLEEKDKKDITKAIECTDYKKGVSILFEDLTKLLYIDDIYETIKLGYIDDYDYDKNKKNRINIMFSKLVNNTSEAYMNNKSIAKIDEVKLLVKLKFYKTILRELERDFEKRNYITSNAFINFYHHKKVKFFELVDRYLDKYFTDNKSKLSQILHTEHSIDNIIIDYTKNEGDLYFVNSYFQVLSKNEKIISAINLKTLLKDAYDKKEIDKPKYFPLDKQTFEDIVQTSGKYILYRYIEEQEKESNNTLKFYEVLKLDDVEEQEVEEIYYENRIEENINIKNLIFNKERQLIIPVIQRDYCMGSNFDDNDNNDDMLDYIIKSFTKGKNDKITLSAITIFQLSNNEVYIYDGQQRIFTLACLIKLLDNSNTEFCEFLFEHREKFNDFTEKFFQNPKLKFESDSYAKKSIENLKNSLENKLNRNKNIDKKELQDYILNNVNLDVININGKLSSAEQFFVEINDGTKLAPYEIFKCKINDAYKKIVEKGNNDIKSKYENWINLIDNQWLDFFYKFNNTKFQDEKAQEEIIEMRFIEFCCRMIYWEKYLLKENKSKEKHPLELSGFTKNSDIGDCDKFINNLKLYDFKRIEKILNGLINIKLGTDYELIKFEVGFNRGGEYLGIPYYKEYETKYREVYLNKFIKSLGYEKEDKYKEYRKTDIVIWSILNNLDKPQKAESIIRKWNKTKVEKEFSYITPNDVYLYKLPILPIPIYYYDDKYVNIYEKILCGNELKKLLRYYDEMMNVYLNIPNNGSKYSSDNMNYKIYYPYHTKSYYFTMIKGIFLVEYIKIDNYTFILSNKNEIFRFEVRDSVRFNKFTYNLLGYCNDKNDFKTCVYELLKGIN